jgi:hypothetical protein
VDVIKQEEALVDEELFMILQRLIQSAAQAGEEESAEVLVGLQQDILENTEYGQEILKTSQEQQTAIKALEEASKKGLTRESLLDLILEAADSEIKLATMVSMARGGLDYAFFQLLSERIERSSGEKRAELTALREQLLEMTHEIDQAVKAQEKLVNQALDDILGADDIEEATLQAMPVVNEIFLEVLRHRIKHARDDENQAALEKLQKVSRTIQKVSAPGANIDLIEALIQAENEAAVNEILEENSNEITDDFMQFLMNLLNQTQGQQGVEQTAEKLQQVYRQVLRFSMKRNLEAQA